MNRGLDRAERAFPVFAHVDKLHGVEAGAEFVGGEFVGVQCGHSRDSAGFAVACGREFGDGAAHGIGGEAQRARRHRKRIPEQQTAGKRFAEAGEELDRFGRLDGSDESGEDAEHASFGAVGHGAGRGWLGKKAAISGTATEIENARLPLEALNRSVNERATGKHAGVVDEVTCRKIVRAVENDVVSGDEREGIITRETSDYRRDLD